MKLAARDRRAALVGVATVTVAAGYVGLVKPLGQVRADLDDRRATALEYLDRYRGIVADSAALIAAADTAQARLARVTPLTYAEEAGSAMPRLLEHVQRVAAAARVRVLRTNPVPGDTVMAGLRRMGVGLSCESDLAGLLDLLRALETGEKLVHVSGLRVDAAGEAGEGAVQVLRFDLTVEAFVDVPQTGSVSDAQTPAP